MTTPTSHDRSRRTSSGSLRRAARWSLASGLVLLATSGWAAGSWMAGQAPRIDRLATLTPDCPSRLYGDPTRFTTGAPVSLEETERRLHDARYRATATDELPRGTYRITPTPGGARIEVRLRPFPVALPDGFRGDGLAEIVLDADRVDRITWQGVEWSAPLPLDPPRLASYYDDSLQECREVRIDGLPEHVARAVLAAEDDDFFDHAGISVLGIARAAWVNLREGGIRQGGSTITQQLVKNLYLDPTRSFRRKFREAGLALLADHRYEKNEILEAYLNRIYWGRSGSVQLIGIAAAAEAFFGRDPEELTIEEAALLAGMIQSPGSYDPRRNPHEAQQRRDWVLTRMAKLGWIDTDAFQQAIETPIGVRLDPFERNRVGHFAEFVAAEASERYGVELAGRGYRLLSTLRFDDQRAASEALDGQLAELAPESGLEGALVSVRPADGAILAYVGGRDFDASPFDRASQARRQVGSLYKPFVYAAAFQHGALPGDRVEDAPLTLQVGDEVWTPRNHKRDFRGEITVREALEKSLNVPAVKVAMRTGLSRVARTAGSLGVPPEHRYPSMALGASTYSPVEMASAFATLAGAGRRPEIHGLQAIYDPAGERLFGREPLEPEAVIDPTTVHLVNSVLQGVVRRGTAWRLTRLGVNDAIAGKTGTSNDTRDAWFAGYSPDRATVVWVGHDDNRPTGFLGGRAALPVFAAFATAVRPAQGFDAFEAEPEGIVRAEVDLETGYLATEDCPEAVEEVFPEGREPVEPCPEHAVATEIPPLLAYESDRGTFVVASGAAG